MANLYDRVQESTTTTGTGTYALGGAVTGFRTFNSQAANGTVIRCVIEDGVGGYEVGDYTLGTNTLARTTIIESSNSNNAVNWGSGTKYIYSDATARDVLPDQTSNSGKYLVTDGTNASWANLGTVADQSSFKEVTSVLPTIKPSLLLDFANTETLDPRITFTRATTATYYDGVTTAMAEQNLVTYSQTFSNAAWVASNVTVGAVTTAPDGTSTAYPLTASAGNGTLLQTFTATATAYTFSIYIQRVTGTGNIDITVDGVTYATQTTTGTWTRFNVTTTPAAGSKTVGIRLVTSGDVVNIWGAQLEQRSSVTSYTATTTQPITNYIPVLKTAASGVARFDHNPTTDESLGLLIEEQRTNLLTYSEQFDNAAWIPSNVTIAANTIVAPDGTLTGDKLVESIGASQKFIRQTKSGLTTTAHTFTFYAKAAERSWCAAYNEFSTAGVVYFDLANGVLGNVASGVTASITSVGNGWFRCSLSNTFTATSGNVYIHTVSANGSLNYTGNGYSGIYIWGAQLEAGAFATSYIPTVASTVTRNADAASMTGANFSSWYNAGEGTVYSEAAFNGINPASSSYLLSITAGVNNANNCCIISNYTASNGQARVLGYSAATLDIDLYPAYTASTGVYTKLALGIKTNDYAVSRNGAAVVTDTSAGTPPVNQMVIGASSLGGALLNGTIKKLAYYTVRLSNTNLQGLTA